MNDDLVLKVTDLSVDFVEDGQTVHAVQGLSYSIRRGQAVGLVGESGSGKSVGALAILGLLPRKTARVSAGTALFEGKELIGMSDPALRRLRGSRISIVFQDPLSSLNPVISVGRQITEILELHLKLSRAAALTRAVELLRLVGIPSAQERMRAYPHQFSGGMRQRAMIAMALACEPALIIADEPTTALDVTIQAQILELLDRLRRELKMAILLITHDIGVVARFTDRVCVIYAGRIIEDGPTEMILSRPRHPYTIGLLRSLPRLDKPRRQAFATIEGAPPDPAHPMEGCPFRPRCAWAIDRCGIEDPEPEIIAEGWSVRCWVKPSEQVHS